MAIMAQAVNKVLSDTGGCLCILIVMISATGLAFAIFVHGFAPGNQKLIYAVEKFSNHIHVPCCR
jgi:hypothetical protein